MKLKLVVATMIVAGAVSVNAFADDTQMQLDAMKSQIAQMQAAINANNAGTKVASTDGWANRISIGGLLNVDANGSSKYSPTNFTSSHPSAITIANANLFVDANVSDWTKAHLGLVYATAKNADFNYLQPGQYTSSNNGNNVRVDEAYVTIGNFAKSPFFMKAGQQFLPFGDYKPYQDLTPSTTQILSQVNAPSAQVGFVANNGMNGSLYALDGMNKISGTTVATRSSTNSHDAIRNWGANLGFNSSYNNLGYNLGVGYLYNMADVTGVSYALNNSSINGGVNGYTKATGGVAANVGLKYSAFDAAVKYVGAVQSFSRADISYNNGSARPSAWNADLGYSFPVLAHDSRFGLGYQNSRQASGIVMTNTTTSGFGAHMPKNRYLANYTVNVSKYTDLGFEIRHDIDYSVANGGTGNNTNTATARLAVKFA